MGLTFLRGSRIYLDTAPLIYTIEEHGVYWPELQPVWTEFRDGKLRIVTSELSLLETLVRPIREGNAGLANAYDELLTAGEVSLIPVTTSILRAAAELRANHNLKTPDAIHAATAIASNCDYLVANDNGFRRLTDINVIILADLV